MSARQSSAVDEALRLVAQGMTPYAAALKVGIALSTVYRARERSEYALYLKSCRSSGNAPLPVLEWRKLIRQPRE